MKKIIFATGYVVILSVLAWACTSTEEDESTKDLNKKESDILMNFKAEVEVGRNMAGRLLQYYGTVGNAGLLSYVAHIGTYIGNKSDFPQTKYMFEILDSDIVNAFACPGGYILVTKGAIKHARNEAELAGILAHEIAHVGKKHMLDQIKSMSDKEIEAANELAAAMEGDPILDARRRPKPESTSLIADTLEKYLSGGGLGVGIMKAAGAGMAVMLDKGLGAEKEYEADFHGVKYAVNAGYSPGSLSQYLCRLKYKANEKGNCKIPKKEMTNAFAKLKVKEDAKSKDSKKSKASSKDAPGKTILDRTHPPIPQRVAYIYKSLAEIDGNDIVGALGTKRFLKQKANLNE